MQNKGNHILSFSAWRGAIFFYLLLGTVTATNSFGQANLLLNPSFEIGNPATGWASISNWFSSQSGDLVAAGDAHQGTNVMRMLAYGSGSKLLNQTFPVTAGRVYSADGWLKTVAGAQSFSPANGYCTVLFRFFDSTGARVGANCDTIHFVRNGPTNWTQYSTGPCYAQAGAVTGEVSCYYYAGADNTSTGWVYYDDMHAVTTTPSQAGTILNPDFEVQGSTTLADIPYWTAFGNAGIVSTNYSRSGRFSLNLYFPETLLGETWTATPGTKYVTSGYIFSPGGFASTTNAHGEILLQFLDSTGTNVLQTYESPYFTPASASNQWIYVEASGIAPAGTVSGRTMCALLGQTNGYNGSLYFDDVNQGVIATTDTVAGILHNPGFDDGGPGNAYDLSVSTNLPHWTWLGGTNGGFITQSYERDGVQSLAITYPSNLIGQSMGVVTGSTYVLDGYMSSPVGQAISNSAYGALILEFYIGTNLASSVSSAPFTSNSTAGTWYHFAVTNRAPWSGSVSSRVLCAVFGPTTNFGGAVYFDSLSLTGTAIAVTNQQAGALWNPGFEYTAVGTVLAEIDNWTALGNAGTVLDSYHRSGNNALQIYFPGTLISQTWPASQSNRYETSAYAFSPSANRFTSTTNAR